MSVDIIFDVSRMASDAFSQVSVILKKLNSEARYVFCLYNADSTEFPSAAITPQLSQLMHKAEWIPHVGNKTFLSGLLAGFKAKQHAEQIPLLTKIESLVQGSTKLQPNLLIFTDKSRRYEHVVGYDVVYVFDDRHATPVAYKLSSQEDSDTDSDLSSDDSGDNLLGQLVTSPEIWNLMAGQTS